MDQYFFLTPFASLGDQTVIPTPTDSGGAVSMQQGWGPDYQRDQASDPLAKPIDRATTNWLFYVVTTALSALQKTGTPEWISPANNGGVAFAYAKYATVRYSATVPATTFETYVSTVDNNTSVPGADSNWQPVARIVAAGTDVVAGTSNRLIVTPLALQSYPGNTAQTFNVKTATNAAHAVQFGQAQNGGLNYAAATGTADAITASLTSGLSALTDGFPLTLKAASANATSTPTLNLTLGATATGAITIKKGAGAALAPADIAGANHALELEYNSVLNAWMLLNPATGVASAGAVIGQRSNLTMSLTAAAASGTMTADEIVVGTALGGTVYKLGSFNQTINLATTGAGGMDTGAAPASGYVALYAIYNPSNGARALLATNAATKQGNVYGGANTPAGYTASALVSVWPTNSSGQLVVGAQIGRKLFPLLTQVLSSTISPGSWTSLNLSAVVPANAQKADILAQVGSSIASGGNIQVAGSSAGVGQKGSGGSWVAGGAAQATCTDVPLLTAQTIYYQSTVGGGTAALYLGVCAYEI